MPVATSARVHPTAIISPQAYIGEDCEIGPFAVIEGRVTLGAHCAIRHHATLIGPMEMGEGNTVFGGAILGELPQHLKFNGEETRVVIGDHNVFRENVTVHRGTTGRYETRIGNNNFLMAGSHIAHDAIVGNHCILANNALVAGHCILEDYVYMSGNSALHQFCRMGRLSLLSGCSASTKDVPPFTIQQHINHVCGVNVVGMRRAGIPAAGIDAIRRAYQLIHRTEKTLPSALMQLEADLGDVDVVVEMISFIRESSRGINIADTHHGLSGNRHAA